MSSCRDLDEIFAVKHLVSDMNDAEMNGEVNADAAASG